MKQLLLSIFASVVIVLGLLFSNVAQVQALSLPVSALLAAEITEPLVETEITEPVVTEVAEPVTTEVTEPVATEITEPLATETAPTEVAAKKTTDESVDLLKQLETQILPQIESVLTPEQQAEFATKVASGTSFRKAFKAVTLTPAQKSKLSTVFKAIPKKDIFTTLTPAQKKQLFLKNKQLFIPTSEEIGAKVTSGMQMAKDKSPLAPSSESIVEKITAKMKAIGGE